MKCVSCYILLNDPNRTGGLTTNTTVQRVPVSSLSSATWCLIFMVFTGCDHPVQRSHSPENAIDWLQ